MQGDWWRTVIFHGFHFCKKNIFFPLLLRLSPSHSGLATTLHCVCPCTVHYEWLNAILTTKYTNSWGVEICGVSRTTKMLVLIVPTSHMFITENLDMVDVLYCLNIEKTIMNAIWTQHLQVMVEDSWVAFLCYKSYYVLQLSILKQAFWTMSYAYPGPRDFLLTSRDKRERSGNRKPLVAGDANLTIMLR